VVLVWLRGTTKRIPDAYYLKEVPMIAKLTQAIQAQQKLIDDLTARVAELESGKTNEPVAE
jgi:hypothetical protein